MKIKEGKKYIVRANRAGVFYGEIAELDMPSSVTMRNVRKIYEWYGACAVEEIANIGTTRPSDCKITVTVAEMEIAEPIQVIEATDEAVRVLDGVREWKK